MTATQTHESVKEYYGQTLKTSSDLKTGACCLPDAMPEHLRKLLKNIHAEVQDKFYGCGSPIPHAIKGVTVLDLGCGCGRDSYLLSQLVGENGRVIGVDMTDEQLTTANKYVGYHMDKFGYKKTNVEFSEGFIEDLKTAGIENNSVDVVISNCVINLSPEKEKVFAEIFRVLKPGGELYFSDVFADRRIAKELKSDPVFLGECLGGAMYVEDFRRMLQNVGCFDYRVEKSNLIAIDDPKIKNKAGMIGFHSLTIRTFKCDFEDRCENFGHVAWYNGTIENSPHEFVLDDHHIFKTGLPVSVCGNTAMMLANMRYKNHFRVEGNFANHYGIFDCSPAVAGKSEIV